MPNYKLDVVKALDYQRPEIENGYNDQTLHVDISEPDIAIEPVQQKTRDIFIGGKGYDLWLLWHAVQADTRWDDPQNAICIACGRMSMPSWSASGRHARTIRA